MAGSDLVAIIQAIVVKTVENMHPESRGLAQDGHIVPGSWDAKEGTVDVKLLEMASTLDDNVTEQALIRYGVQLATTAPGMQGPPVGGERVVLIPRHSGWSAILEHGNDDSPGAPAGEHWVAHSSGSSVKLTNDGHATLVGKTVLSGAAPTVGLTSTGSTSISAGTSATVSGATVSISASGIVSITGTNINIGSSGMTLGGGATHALVLVTELNALISALNAHTHNGVQGGGSTSGPPSSPFSSASGSSFISAS